jgi:hypothetical protein
MANVPAFYSVNEDKKPAANRVHHTNDTTCAPGGIFQSMNASRARAAIVYVSIAQNCAEYLNYYPRVGAG